MEGAVGSGALQCGGTRRGESQEGEDGLYQRDVVGENREAWRSGVEDDRTSSRAEVSESARSGESPERSDRLLLHSQREIVILVDDLQLANDVRRLLLQPSRVIAVPPKSDWGNSVFLLCAFSEDPLSRRVAAKSSGTKVLAIHGIESPQKVAQFLTLPTGDDYAINMGERCLGALAFVATHVDRLEKSE